MRALLIEDDEKLAELTREYLEQRDVTVQIVSDGAAGFQAARAGAFDVILLDLMLPNMDGLEICKRLRRESSVPVIILSARGDEVDKVVGLEIGADDYLAKPFSPRELLARMNAVVRRHQPSAPADGPVTSGPLMIDRGRRIATICDTPLELTAHQFDVLWVLALKPGRVLTRKEIYREVRTAQDLPPEDFDPAIDRSVDVHLSKIRQAFDAKHPGTSRLVKTVRGVGYVLDASTLAEDGG